MDIFGNILIQTNNKEKENITIDLDQLIKCEKCGCKLFEREFFYYRDKSKGIYPICKKCLYKQIDSNKYSTFVWLLKELDYPLVIYEWKKLKEHYPNKPILGRYLARMNLFSWKVYCWEDSKELNQSMRTTDIWHPLYMNRDSDYLVANFDMNHIDIDKAAEIHNKLIQSFPNNKVISLPNDYNLRTMSKEKLRQIKQQIELMLGDENNE